MRFAGRQGRTGVLHHQVVFPDLPVTCSQERYIEAVSVQGIIIQTYSECHFKRKQQDDYSVDTLGCAMVAAYP